jgi:hypothetical protein
MHVLPSIQRDMTVLLCQSNRGSVLNMVGEDTFMGMADIYTQSSKIKWPEIVEVPNRKRRKEQKSSLFVSFLVSLYLYIHGVLFLPFITLTHAAYVLTKHTNTFAKIEVKT